jgi:hypothetical protein
MRYSVELRKHTYDGDYLEDHFMFETKEECLDFARKNRRYVYAVQDYEDRDYDPVDISF